MHPDLKVGLALTLLIVGFAAAMCFRHHPDEAAARPEIAADPNLDAELELLPVRTYGPESGEDEDETETPADDAATDVTADITGELEIPEPIDAAGDEPPAGGGDGTENPAAPPPEATGTTTYVVRSGDTLSGISAALLGSTQRYDEIFEANRHLLNSPDDLRPGMELTIPPREQPPAASEETVSAPLRNEPTPAAQAQLPTDAPR
jgi:hypothetical protein